MKKYLLGLVIIGLAVVGCTSDEKEEDKVVKKYIKEISLVDEKEKMPSYICNYDENNKLVSINDSKNEKKDVILDFDNSGNLNKIKLRQMEFEISKFLKVGDKAYKFLKIQKYDSNKNPTVLEFYGEIGLGIIDDLLDRKSNMQDEIDGDEDNKGYIINITYDDKPFFANHTLQAAGIMNFLNTLKLNFAEPGKPADTKMAKEIIPVNNITKIELANIIDKEIFIVIEINYYAYDKDNYPTNIKARYSEYKDGRVADEERYEINVIYK